MRVQHDGWDSGNIKPEEHKYWLDCLRHGHRDHWLQGVCYYCGARNLELIEAAVKRMHARHKFPSPSTKVRVISPSHMAGEIVVLNGTRFQYPGQNFWVHPVIKQDGTEALVSEYEPIVDSTVQPVLFDEQEVQRAEQWKPGMAFVYAGEGVVEYFKQWELDEGKYQIRSFCGALREPDLCRPLDYVCDLKYLETKI